MIFDRTATEGARQPAVSDTWRFPALDRAVARRAGTLEPSAAAVSDFAAWMNRQTDAKIPTVHAILPPAFYETFLGPQLHMGSAHYVTGTEDLMAGEQNALQTACALAGLANRQEILDLGCGWGAVTLLVAETYASAHVTAFTTSPVQAAYVQAQAAARGLCNVTVQCGALAAFTPATPFDRVVCMDMMANVANWRALLLRVRGWLKSDGRLFAQTPTHITTPYRMNAARTQVALTAPAIMPSQGLIRHFNDLFKVNAEQHWSGKHPARTALQWLANFDRNHEKAGKLLHAAYGRQAEFKRREWRVFFLQSARLHGHAFGEVWGVGQYAMSPCHAPERHLVAGVVGNAVLAEH
jgi:cyclopropane-fatty-acyl-phospholipid synthase